MSAYLEKLKILEQSKLEKIKQLELEQQKLIDAREQEIMKLVKKVSLIEIDNDYIIGALIKLKEAHKNNEAHLLNDYSDLAKKAFPKRTKKQDSKAS